MRYHLALLPDRGDGQPDYSANPGPILLLPEGTTRLDIDAHWSADKGDGFQGGTSSFTVELED